MKWIVQNNLHLGQNEAVINHLGDRAILVNYFDGSFTPEIDLSEPCIVFGSTGFVASLQPAMHNRPGYWPNLKHGVFDWVKAYGKFCVNWDAKLYTLDELPYIGAGAEDNVYRFVRPIHDGKAFAGRQYQQGVAQRVVDDLIRSNYGLDFDYPVAVSSAKEIHNEIRVWIVDGSPVGSAAIRQISDDLPFAEVETFAETLAQVWTPEPVAVFDISGPPWRLVEINSFNCSGFYSGVSIGGVLDSVEKWAEKSTALTSFI